jgi:hypothetical protein
VSIHAAIVHRSSDASVRAFRRYRSIPMHIASSGRRMIDDCVHEKTARSTTR